MDTRDWNLWFICRSDNSYKPTVISSSVKLRSRAERYAAWYKELVDSIQELKELGDLPDFVAIDDIGGDGSTESIVQLMMSHKVVWHKTWRNAVNNQKVWRARNKHKKQEPVRPVKTRRMDSGARSSTQVSPTPPSCLNEPVDAPDVFCDEVGNKKELRKADTLGLDKKSVTVLEC